MRDSILPLSVLLLAACSGRGGETGDDYTESSADGFTVEGTAVNLMDTSLAAAEGLCVDAADPTPAISGGEAALLQRGTVAADGTFAVEGIETTSAVGLLMVIDDCEGEDTVMRTATGIAVEDYQGLGTGDVIADREIFSIDGATLDGMTTGLADAGYSGSLEEEGALIGFVFAAEDVPADGAVVSGPDGFPTYYLQADGVSWAEGGTVAAAGATFIIPGAPIYNYKVTADGLTFEDLLAGSQPAHAVVVAFTAVE